MAIICLLSLLPSISVLANENYITDPATSLRGKIGLGSSYTFATKRKDHHRNRTRRTRPYSRCQHYRKRNDKREHYGHGW